MRHRVNKFQLNRFTSWRRSTVLSLVRNLLIRQSVKTTRARAALAKPLADKIISLAKENTLSARRQAFRLLGDHLLVSRLFKEASRFSSRSGGYTRILNLGARRGDNARMVIFELTEIKKKEPPLRKKKKELEGEKKDEPILATTSEAQQEPGPEGQKGPAQVAVKKKPPITKKPTKNFLGGLRNIFKKERDSL
jgi:large subunit ribosomal protein L17